MLHNMTPTSANEYGVSPHEAAFGELPDDSKLEIFGRSVWVTPGEKSHKDEPTRKGVWCGINTTNNTNRVCFEQNDEHMASYRETIDVKYETGKPLLDAVADGKVPLQTPDYVPFEDEGFEEPDDFVEPPGGGV